MHTFLSGTTKGLRYLRVISALASLSPVIVRVFGSRDRAIVALDDALTAFAKLAPRQAKVVELRYFGGLTDDEIVAALDISPRAARRDWHFAKAWLLRELDRTGANTSGTHS